MLSATLGADFLVTSRLAGLLSIPLARTAMIAAAVFVIDCLTPLGIAAGALYMAAVLSAVPMRYERAIYLTAGICSLLVLVGWTVSPGQGHTEWWKVLTNRAVDLGVIWAAAGMAGLWRRSQQRQLKQMLETRLLHQATALSVSQLTFRDALRNSLKTLCDIVGWPVGHVYLRDNSGQALKASDIWHVGDDGGFELLRVATRGLRFQEAESAVGQAWKTGEPVAVGDVSESPGYAWLKEPDRLGIVGAFLLPVTIGGKVVAVMEFFSEQSIQVDDEFMPLARNVGEQLGRLFERRKAEQAVRQGEERLRLALQGGRMGTWEWHLDTNRIIWSPELEEIYGHVPGSLAPTLEAAYEVVHPEDRQRVNEVIERGIEESGAFRVEYRVIRPDGCVQWIESRGAVHRDNDGQPQRLVGICINVTERKQYEEQNARLAAIVQSSDDAILAKSLDGTILSWNNGAARIYGYGADEIVGRSVADLCPEDRKDDFPGIMERIARGERLEHYETVRQRKDGQLIDISLSVSPIRDSDGTVTGASAVARDITERKKAEREMAEAREKAETANRLQSRFLANMSHELRTPMNSILGMLQLSLGEDLTPEIRSWLSTAKSSADSLLVLLNDLLDLSKIEAGTLTVHPEPFPLRSTVDATVRAFAAKAFENGLELVYDVAERAPNRVVGDKLRIRQVLTNLITNAIKFTREGEVVISVACGESDRGTTDVCFAVRDTGAGIPEDDQRRIFEPFIQSDASTERLHGGAGLGLAISRELVRRMGGELRVESELGHGSTFSFVLPMATTEEKADDDPRLEDPPPIEGMPVLVVDRSETNRLVLTRMLEGWSMVADVAIDFDHAVGKLYRAEMEGRRYRLVIVDSGLIDEDDMTLAARLEDTLDEAPDLIFMGRPGIHRAVAGQSANCEDAGVCLEKPVSPSSLLAAIRQALGFEQAAVRTNVKPAFSQPALRSLQILLAEDTPANQQVVESILSRRGHRITIAQDGHEAVGIIQKRAFDVVLMDVCMPGMDGFETTKVIRQQELGAGRRVPIIALTAHAMQGDREKCLAAGMDQYLAKPIDVAKLVEAVEAAARDSADDDAATDVESAVVEAPAPIIDYRGTLERLGGDEALFHDVVRLFEEDSPGLLRTIRAAMDDNDAPELRRAAHSLKGLAANFGATDAVQRAYHLEQIGKSGRLDGADVASTELEEEIARLTKALAPYRNGRIAESETGRI